MASPLFQKFYVDALGDPKLRRAARQGHRGLELLPWLLLWARAHGENGRLTLAGEPVDARDVAETLPGVSPKRVQTAIRSLFEASILTQDADGAFRFVAWDARNPEYESNSKGAVRERVRAHRQRKSGKTRPVADSGGDVTSDVTSGVTTPPVTDVTSVTRVDIEEDIDIEEDSRGASVTPLVTPTPPKPARSWPGRLAQVWTESVGVIDPGRLGRELKPLVVRHGEALVGRAIRQYGRRLLDEGRIRFASPGDFARTSAQWLADAQPVGERQFAPGGAA